MKQTNEFKKKKKKGETKINFNWNQSFDYCINTVIDNSIRYFAIIFTSMDRIFRGTFVFKKKKKDIRNKKLVIIR